MEGIYSEIAARTGGNIYIGVVGPVRTGKSALIKRIVEELVIQLLRIPTAGSGRGTNCPGAIPAEPKFIPEEAVEISPDGTSQFRVRMIDSVGYMVNGAVGAEEEGAPRMVTTPWADTEIPMTQAAELGTRKVMEEHCTIGLVITTDGSITEIPRGYYLEAERRAILDMKATGKPFPVVVNTREPGGEAASAAAEFLQKEYGIRPCIADCQSMDRPGIANLFREILAAFPMKELRVYLSGGWMRWNRSIR